MKKVGNILNLFISEREKKERINKSTLSLDSKGIITDKFYDKDIQRSILITSIESYKLLEEHNIAAEYGILGENLLTDFNPYHLTPGIKLQIGETVIVQISQYCTICNHLSSINEKVPTLLKKDRGIFATVITKGIISQGDNIFLLSD